jgi:hypothetical protein
VYFGGNVLFKSTDHGHSWQVISPDLTTNDPAKQQSSGGPIVVDNTAAEFHCTIISIAPSPLDPNVIWVGTDDGNVQVTRDGGKTWSNVFKNVPGLKPNAWIPTVDASHSDAGTAYVAADHHQDDDYTPYAYMTTDYGKTWTRITGDLPAKAAWVHVVREDPKNKNLLYIGSEMGAWASWDRGVHWHSLRGDLPIVPVRDIQVHPRDNDILLATHGRGLYILDDAAAVQQLGEAMKTDATLFDIRPAVRWSLWSRDGNLGQMRWSGDNPPQGALVTYYLKNQPAGEVNITVTDAAGKVVRRMRRVADDAGVNRVAWDLRYDAPVGGGGGFGGGGRGAGAAGQEADTSLEAVRARRRAQASLNAETGGGDEFFGPVGGPSVLPGVYTVTLTADGKSYVKTVQVENDPRSDMTPAELSAQLDASMQARDLTTRSNRIIARVDNLSRQLTALQEQFRAPANADVARDIASAIKDLKQFKDSVLARPIPGLGYRQYPRLREEIQTISGMVSRPLLPPTEGELLRLSELKVETDAAQARLDAFVRDRIGAINSALGSSPHIITTGGAAGGN